ncbi:DUF4288 domain-containing protein [Pedobacter alluvionis]|uniref:DUF4288 domain-containing protein n=1 Tax=Pedobacter alluvionis TaxID=475253 RepID=A0A497XZB6_9SPHI|nr:DUF4288 domain-containing protein [Pedobacter alluvionis]RLJ74686.1 uncharacterized protein DUF4288 [Pedobacter alluvionis]TFB29829.1 DUF4288 domain-containing protein [Pedobacter alluvionis]
MKWFAVNCIYQVICGEGNHTPQFNEQTRLIQAEGIKQALSKANLNAVHFNPSFNNCQGEQVIWKFLGVGGISEVAKLTDGVEVSSRIVEPKSVTQYLEKLAHRNKSLTNQNDFDN